MVLRDGEYVSTGDLMLSLQVGWGVWMRDGQTHARRLLLLPHVLQLLLPRCLPHEL